jgi:hypothetical protein
MVDVPNFLVQFRNGLASSSWDFVQKTLQFGLKLCNLGLHSRKMILSGWVGTPTRDAHASYSLPVTTYLLPTSDLERFGESLLEFFFQVGHCKRMLTKYMQFITAAT